MNVVLLKERLGSFGGLEKYAQRIAHAFSSKGAQVTLLSSTSPVPFSLPPQVQCVRFPVSKWLPRFMQLEQFDQCVRSYVQKHPADIVLGLDRNREQTHLRAGNGVHAAYLYSRRRQEGFLRYGICQINPLHKTILALEKEAFTYKGLRKIIANSFMVQEEILRYYAVDPAQISVIHNGVEWHAWEKPFATWKEQKNALLAQHNLPKDCLHLLFIGNGYQRKGLDLLLQALAVWKRTDVHLSVIGKEKNSARYHKQVRSLGLEQQVRFFGIQPNVLPFYQMADVLVVPSLYDPFANVTVEALAMGLFVLSSKQNGGHEILSPEIGSTIADLFDIDAFITALNKASPKTEASAQRIRLSIEKMDFSYQLAKLMACCER